MRASRLKEFRPERQAQAAVALGTLLCLTWVTVRAQRPELVVQIGHTGSVNSVAFSPDGKTIASGGTDMMIKLWDITAGKELRTLNGHGHGVNEVAFSPDGKTLASASADTTVRLWDMTARGALRRVLQHQLNVQSVAYSPDGKLLAATDGGETVKLWDPDSGKLMRVIPAGRLANNVTFSPDGKKVAVTDFDKVLVWEAATGRKLLTLLGDETDVVTLRDPKTGQVSRVTAPSFTHFDSLAFSPDGEWIAAGAELGHATTRRTAVEVWSANDGSKLRRLAEGDPGKITALAFSPRDGKRLAIGTSLWDVKTNSWVRRSGPEPPVDMVVVGQSNAFSPDGKTLAVGGGSSVGLLDADTGQYLRTFTSRGDAVTAVAFNSAGDVLAASRGNGVIKLWNEGVGRQPLTIRAHSAWVISVLFSPDGRLLASGSGDSTARLWDAATGKLRYTLEQGGYVRQLAFSPDGATLATSGDVVKLWDVAKGKLLRLLPGRTCATFSPDGKTVAAGGSDGKVELSKLATGKRLKTFRAPAGTFRRILFSPDGRVIVGSTEDDMIHVWDAATGAARLSFKAHETYLNALAFSPDGRLASCGWDATVRFWDAANGKELAELTAHTENVTDISFGGDSGLLASASSDTKIKIWDWRSATEVASVFLLGEDDWVVITPDGYYNSSKAAIRGVAFRFAEQVYPFEQFDLLLNRPDIVLKRLRSREEQLINAYRSAHLRRLKAMGVEEAGQGDDLRLPSLKVETAGLPLSTSSGTLSFGVEARGALPGDTLNKINLWVNNVPAGGTADGEAFGAGGIVLADQRPDAYSAEISLELSRGANKIQLSALNNRGAESLRQTFNVTYLPPDARAHDAVPNVFVVAVGVTEYHQDGGLRYAAKDAADLSAYFSRFGLWGGAGRVRVLTLTDRQVTKEAVIQKAGAFLQGAGVDDVAILFFAGHGLLDTDLNYYFGTYDVNFDLPGQKGLPYESIEGLLSDIKARRKLLLMDTCHAGEVDKETVAAAPQQPQAGLPPGVVAVRARPGKSYVGLGNSFALMQELFAELRRGSGATVIAAASGIQYAYEADGNGLFTHALLDGLRGTKPDGTPKADADGNGSVRVSELRDWVFGRVRELSGGRQTPTARREDVEFDWDVKRQLTPAAPPP